MTGLVLELQERAARALPAERVEQAGGWWLRYAPGCSWWVGTVLPHGDGDLARAEAFYAGLGATARFQVSPAGPPWLDPVLAERGYERGGTMSLRVAPTERVAALPGANVLVDDGPTRAWFDVWHAVHDGAPGEWDLLGRVTRPSGFARLVVGGEVVAVGRAVADAGWAGVFGMATLPGARGHGAGTAVLAALAGWAAARGVGRMYLQVERDNGPASRLYDRAGFRELCGYHYRGAPVTPAGSAARGG
ncbi:GNAT family N-acetyltransferase [Actinophytocola gossypii]|uniref:GNAT family N-acetyltransferase n=1 Tax=Actinophytocola gossypii TaxID=2812003 RepID=A0ABT2JIG1_9PSEU|nr:GNAT family N-acetyltransferase [Actinophytocola gossypii]MCT2587667.1 GNAT family N-acetyltransferase [Actinophytocola gossypii]